MATKAPRRRRRAPNEAEWSDVKEIMIRLYIMEKRPLREIALILARDYNFHAEPYMYKVRIKKWKLKKNYKREELAALAESTQCLSRIAGPVPTSTLHELVPVQRAKRHFATHFDEGCQPKSSDSSDGRLAIARTSSTNRNGSHWTQDASHRRAVMPMTTLHHSNELRDFEPTLIQVKNFFIYRLSRSNLPSPMAEKSHQMAPDDIDPSSFFGDIESNCALIESGDTQAAPALIGAIQEKAERLLQCVDEHFMYVLVQNCFWPLSRRTTDLGISAYAYIRTVSRKVLGQAHPVTMILELASRSGRSIAPIYVILELMFDLALRLDGSRSELAAEIELRLVDMAVDYFDFYSASKLCQRALQRHSQCFGVNTPIYKNLVLENAKLHWRHHFYTEAETIFQKILVLSKSGDDGVFGDQLRIESMTYLGFICEDRMDFKQAHSFFFQVYEDSVQLYGLDDPRTKTRLHDLERVQAKKVPKSGKLDHVSAEHKDACRKEVVDKFAKLQQEMEQLHLDKDKDEGAVKREMPWNVKRPVDEDVTEDPDDQSSLGQSLGDWESPITPTDRNIFDQEIEKSQYLLSLPVGEIGPIENILDTGELQDQTHISDFLEPLNARGLFQFPGNGAALLDDVTGSDSNGVSGEPTDFNISGSRVSEGELDLWIDYQAFASEEAPIPWWVSGTPL